MGRFSTYGEAEATIDRLARRGFPIERSAIIARNLSFVENVTGRRTYLRAAADGIGGGALVGALFGFFFGLFQWVDPLVSALALLAYGALFGAIVGALASLILHLLGGRSHDFASTGTMQAAFYDIVVDDQWADDALRGVNL